ncbi:MAG: RES family NAD+ phosphorylase [Planctomycetota bacterium]
MLFANHVFRIPRALTLWSALHIDLPHGADTVPFGTQEIGTNWIHGQTSLVLVVPSAINPLESNMLVNRAHPEMKKLKVEPGQSFQFDPRMFGKQPSQNPKKT